MFNINYAYFGNPLWAHNDFIQIFSDYGMIGLIVYLGMFRILFKKTFKDIKISKLAMLMLVTIWVFNAFFNMFYTYFCATLSYPFYCMIVKIDAIKEGVILCKYIIKILYEIKFKISSATHAQFCNEFRFAECEV